MAARDRYVLVSVWRVGAPLADVWSVFEQLVDAPDPFAWWPDLEVRSRSEDALHVVTRSRLGYRLRFRLHALRTEPPHTITVESTGDLNGAGRIVLTSDPGGGTRVHIDWTVTVNRPWMRWTRPVLRPVFVASHRYVMRRGERALRAWVA
ncbi:MAG: hypothetical protein P1U38_00125 [Aeromicrobium sp.]|uniref:SRPBCC family protein n=1 Tax=Aeromicrobium sp. TaxID=1871063 RepID=UPI0025C4AFCD|nr:SRPBCC family protein [Aeromicrobium sp.]MCK5890869.1 hypothetical protein [Aeromicrobium sp.]MDF1703158.1 hypothetical protein [Aeromicrobium sp.]